MQSYKFLFKECGVNITGINPAYIIENHTLGRFLEEQNIVECVCDTMTRKELFAKLQICKAYDIRCLLDTGTHDLL